MKKHISFYCLLFAISVSACAQEKYATISGNLDILPYKDSVKLEIAKLKSFFHDADFVTSYSASITGNKFTLKVPVKNYPQYADLHFLKDLSDESIKDLIIEQGDSVLLEKTNQGYGFNGRGSFKYNVILHLKSVFLKAFKYYKPDDPGAVVQNYENHDSTALAELVYLDSCKSKLSEKVYLLIKADIIGSAQYKGFTIFPFVPESTIPFINALKLYKENPYLSAGMASLSADTGNLINSLSYSQSIIYRYRVDSCYLKGKDFDITAGYNYLKNNYRGNFREGLVTSFLFDRRRGTQDIRELIEDALSFVTDTDFRSVLLKVESTNLRGAMAYDFSLEDAKGKIWSYHDFKGKAVVLDFWFTSCGACRATAPVLAQVEKHFADKPVVFISVAVDRHKELWLQSLAEGKYCSSSSLNLFTGGKADADPIILHYHVAAYPTLILIDKNGRLSAGVGDIRYDNGKYLESLINSVL